MFEICNLITITSHARIGHRVFFFHVAYPKGSSEQNQGGDNGSSLESRRRVLPLQREKINTRIREFTPLKITNKKIV